MTDRRLELVRSTVAASNAAKLAFAEASGAALVAAARAAAAAVRAGGKILLFGNGGSAADAQHIASEFVNRLDRERDPIAAIALTTDSSNLTSIANDDAYEQVFARQVQALGRRGDVALAISTSGNSPNILAALTTADRLGLLTIGFLGRDGGKCRSLCAHPVIVPDRNTQRIQEVHILMAHLFAELIQDDLYPRTGP